MKHLSKQSFCFLLLAVVLVWVQAAAVAADVVIAFQTHSFSTAYSNQRKIVRNSLGELFVVYTKPIQDQTQVFIAKSVDNGASWRDLGRVSEGNYESVRTALAVDSKDNLHVVWTKFVEEYGQIYYRTFDQEKSTWSTEQALTSGPAYSGFPSIAVDSNDLIHVVWYGFDGRAYQIFYSRFDGLAWSPARQLSQGFPDSVNPAIALDGSNIVHVAWYKNNGRTYQIYVVNSTRDWDNQVVISSGESDSYNPTIAIDRQNTVHVVWDKLIEGATQLFYGRFDRNRWRPQLQLTSGSSSAENPSLAVDAAGNLVVFYDKRDGEIYMMSYSGGWGPEVKLTSSGRNIFPSVRWSYYNNHEDAWPQLDLVWSHAIERNYEVRYVAIQAKHGPTEPAAQPFPFPLLLAAAAIPVIVIGLLMLRKRSVQNRQRTALGAS